MDPLFSPPQVFKAVARPRLFTLFDDHAYRQNILVAGQAAQGKSTLVASYLENKGLPAVWIPLSVQDENASNLFEKLTQGLLSVNCVSDRVKQIQVPRSTLGAKEAGIRHAEALTVCFKDLDTHLVVVLDDLQAVDESSFGFSLIRHLVNLDHKNLTLFLLSRNMPGLDLARLKMDHRLFVLDNESLAFTMPETRVFFDRLPNGRSVDLERIYQITNGWAGGLTLVSEAIRQLKDLSRLPQHLSADLFNFFSREIYDRLDKSIRDFLMRVSVLETMDLAAVDHLTGRSNSLQILRELEYRNLFIQRIQMDGQGARYRLHDLFRTFLLKEVDTVYGDDGARELSRKAGRFFWDQRDYEQAVSYFIRAQAFPDIMEIIRIKGTDCLIKGRMSELDQWIGALPETMMDNDPWLIFFEAMTRRIKGGKKNIDRLRMALALFERAEDDRGILLCLGFLIEAAVFIRLPSHRILAWIKKGEDKLLQIRSSHRFPWARALLWQQIGLGYIAGDGNIPKGLSACQNAVLLSQQIENAELILNASITMTFGHVQAGDFIQARLLLARIEEMTLKSLHPEYRALKTIVDIELALKNAEFETARQMLDTSQADIEKFGLIFLYPGFVEEKSYFLIYTAQYEEACQMADHLNDFSILEGNDFYNFISLRIRAMIEFYRQDYVSALEKVKQACTALDKERKGEIHYHLARQLQGVLLFLNKSHKEAQKVLQPVLEYFSSISSDLSACETAMVLGLVKQALGEETQALQYLQRGLDKAARARYRFFPVINDEMLSRAILYVWIAGPADVRPDHLIHLVKQIRTATILEQLKTMLAAMKKKDQAKAVLNVRPLYRQLLPKIQISCLGQFAVLRQDRPVLFEGSRPVLLLKAIVLQGARDIPKEILIDNLWPDADAASGEKNFKINLHRLRKAIEPKIEKQFGYAYILQKSGRISLDTQLVALDTDAFMQLCRQGEKKENENQPEQALALYEKAALLYRGDYFAEEPYIEWIQHKRDLYRQRFVEVMQKKAALHEELDQADRAMDTWRAILRNDPCHEKAYQNLMILYADSGQTHMAMDTWEECRTILKRELGVSPDNQTRQIYEKIKSMR